MSDLTAAIQLRIQQDGEGQNWDVRFVDWGASSGGTAQGAVRNAVNIGAKTGQEIVAAGKYKKVLLVSHSAGAWMANEIANTLLDNNPNFQVDVAFLDPFVPGTMLPVLLQRSSDDIQYSVSGLGAGIPEAENYFHAAPTWTGLGNVLPYAANYDLTGIQECAGDRGDGHGWPIRWYKVTADNPTWSLGFGLGYPDAFNIQGAKGSDDVLTCGSILFPTVQEQSQTLATIGHPMVAKRLAVSALAPLDIMPPVPESAPLMSRAKRVAVSTSASELTTAASPIQAASPVQASDMIGSNGQFPGSEDAFTNLNILAQGGSGTISTNADGIQLSTSGFLWETVNLTTTNDITLGTLDYALSNHCNSVVGMWIDGQPMTFIQSTPQNPLNSLEAFPLSTALGSGNHLLTVSLESLDGTPVAATLKSAGFYYAISTPVVTSQSVDTNGIFGFTWESAPGLKYQPQSNGDLTSTNWTNIGGLRISPNNAVMSAFEAISTNQNRFYRVGLGQ